MSKKQNEIRNFCSSLADDLDQYKTSSLRHEVFKVLRGVLDIASYLGKSPNVEDYVVKEFDYFVRKISKYIREDLEDSKELLDEQIFSINEWNSYSEERKNSIMAFIAVAVTRSQNLETYSNALENLDDETKKWLSVNCPFEELREVFERGLEVKIKE